MKSLSALLILISTAFISNSQVYKLPELAYSYQEYAPYIDAKTMEIHHSKHHQAYVNNLNMEHLYIEHHLLLTLKSLISKIL